MVWKANYLLFGSLTAWLAALTVAFQLKQPLWLVEVEASWRLSLTASVACGCRGFLDVVTGQIYDYNWLLCCYFHSRNYLKPSLHNTAFTGQILNISTFNAAATATLTTAAFYSRPAF